MEQLIKRPVITEKSLTLAGRGWYSFMVEASASKKQIAATIADHYKVTVTDVRTRMVHGKVRRAGRRMVTVKRPDWKKALVKLAKGQKIDAFEVTGQEETK